MKRKPTPPADDSRRLTYGEAAKLLKVSVRTVRRYVATGLLDKVQVTPGNVLVTEASVRRRLVAPLPTIRL